VAWSIADYLASLEKGVGELLKEKRQKPEQAKAEAKAEPGKPEPVRVKPNLKRRRRRRALNELWPESLQNVFDRAFAGISQVREAFTPQLTATGGGHDHQRRHRHRQGLGSPRRGL
jgi:hypothetical protein